MPELGKRSPVASSSSSSSSSSSASGSPTSSSSSSDEESSASSSALSSSSSSAGASAAASSSSSSGSSASSDGGEASSSATVEDGGSRATGAEGAVFGHVWGSGEDKKFVFDVHLRTSAWVFALIFVVMMGIGVLVTFLWTAYDERRDYILRVFETWSPCVVWDHYPANLISLLLSSVALMNKILEMAAVWLYAGLFNEPLLTATVSALMIISILSQAASINVFAVNLYEYGYKEANEELPQSDVSRVLLHTAWYVGMLLSHVIYSIVIMHVLVRSRGAMPIWKRILAYAGMIVLTIGSFQLWAKVFAGTSSEYIPSTFLQIAFKAIIDAVRMGAWHWVPLFVLPFMAPKSMGLRVTFSLRRTGSVHGRFRPESVIAAAWRVLLGALLVVYLFSDPQHSTVRTTAAPLTSGFREEPFRFVFTPLWLLMVLIVMTGVAATTVRELLVGENPWKSLVSGALLSLSMLSAMLVVIPEIENTAVVFFVMVPLACIYVVAVYGEPKFRDWWRAAVYIAVFLVLAILSAVPLDWLSVVANILLVIQLCFYNIVLPKQHALFWTIEQLGRVPNETDDPDIPFTPPPREYRTALRNSYPASPAPGSNSASASSSTTSSSESSDSEGNDVIELES